MPKGLIPLMLGSSVAESSSSRPRSSLAPPSRIITKLPIASPTTPAHKRNASDITPMIKVSGPPVRAMKRQSQQAPASLPVLPYTSAEWKKAITEIKGYHITRRHRACSARCSEILTNTKDISKVEPAYLIYLNFYAAISLEMCARPLQAASSYRTNLLHQARGYYEKASSLIQTAEEAVGSRSRSSSSASSVPSLHSPSGSVSSRAWTPDTCVMTPTFPTFKKSNLQQEPRSGERGKPRKKVSFELPKDKSRWSFTLPEPIVRPDSPTLGFDDEYFAAGASRQVLPELPSKRWSRVDFDAPRIEPVLTSPPSMPSISEGEELSPASSPSMPSISEGEELSPASSPSSSSQGDIMCAGYYFNNNRYDDNDSDESFSSSSSSSGSSSLSRYCDTLSSLKAQVASHLASLDDLLESDQQEALVTASQDNHHQQQHQPEAAAALMYDNNAAAATVAGRQRGYSSMSLGSYGPGGDEDVARLLDLRARVDRLRMIGWKRKRFNAARYEELCGQVMAELGEPLSA